MSEEQAGLIRRSWTRVVSIADTAATSFYAKLFALERIAEAA